MSEIRRWASATRPTQASGAPGADAFFTRKEKPTRGHRPDSQEFLLRAGRLERCSEGRRIALTFDADLTSADLRAGRPQRSFYDRDIVRTLRRSNTPATLFVTGLRARHYPNATRKLARVRLFELANYRFVTLSELFGREAS